MQGILDGAGRRPEEEQESWSHGFEGWLHGLVVSFLRRVRSLWWLAPQHHRSRSDRCKQLVYCPRPALLLKYCSV